MSEVSISTPHQRLKGYLATPQGEGPWSGAIVLHDIFGLTDVTRGHADWLAREGYLAVAPDLFSWGSRIRCIRALTVDPSARIGVQGSGVR
jgi:carboxymethylenebutenolidase